MSEYIKREDVIDVCKRLFRGTLMPVATREDINAIPAADVEPVVRCGRCKYALIDAEGFVETCEYWNEEFNTFHLTTMHPDGYCSNGVERSGGDEKL